MDMFEAAGLGAELSDHVGGEVGTYLEEEDEILDYTADIFSIKTDLHILPCLFISCYNHSIFSYGILTLVIIDFVFQLISSILILSQK